MSPHPEALDAVAQIVARARRRRLEREAQQEPTETTGLAEAS